MANRYAVATGNWSSTATWDGGTLPAPGDTVRPNTFVVTIDQDLTGTTYELRSDASAPAAAGGQFVVSSIPGGGRTINANLSLPTQGSFNHFLQVTATSGTLTINGTVAGTTQNANCHTVSITAAGSTVIINGSVTGGTHNGNTSHGAVNIQAVATLIINGDVTGGGGSSTGQKLGVWINSAAATVTINGDVNGGTSSTSASHGLMMTSAGTVTVNGDANSGASTGGNAISFSAGTVIVTGTVTANANIAAIGMSGTPNLDLQGAVVGHSAFPAVTSTATGGVVRVRGPITDAANGRRAVFSPFLILHASPTDTDWTVRDDANWPSNGNAMVLTNIGNGMPDPADVAEGVVYGTAAEHTGTMETSALTAAAVWDYLTADADTAGSMGLRLRNTATVDSTGAQLAAALGE